MKRETSFKTSINTYEASLKHQEPHMRRVAQIKLLNLRFSMRMSFHWVHKKTFCLSVPHFLYNFAPHWPKKLLFRQFENQTLDETIFLLLQTLSFIFSKYVLNDYNCCPVSKKKHSMGSVNHIGLCMLSACFAQHVFGISTTYAVN